MIDPKIFDDIVKKLGEVLPPSIKNLQQDLERNFKSVLQSSFAKLDLVTREEFDVQSSVLARTRVKLEDMEARVASLERQSSGGSQKDNSKFGG